MAEYDNLCLELKCIALHTGLQWIHCKVAGTVLGGSLMKVVCLRKREELRRGPGLVPRVAIRSQTAVIRSQTAAIRSQTAEIHSQKVVIQGSKVEIQSQTAAIRNSRVAR